MVDSGNRSAYVGLTSLITEIKMVQQSRIRSNCSSICDGPALLSSAVQEGVIGFLFSWGEIYIDSAIVSILNGTTPLFTLLIAHFAIADDRMTVNKVVGALIGFAGLVLLVSPSLRGGIQTTALGLLASS